MSRAATLVGFTAAVLAASRALASCIIADPPAEPPMPQTAQPSILDQYVVPTPPLITEWPVGGFVVPIQASTTSVYALYVDNLNTPVFLPPPVAAPADGGYQANVSQDAPDGGCHIIYFGVEAVLDSNNPPPSPGVMAGDMAFWFYYPTGQGGCSGFDASAFGDGAFPPGMDGFSPPPVMVDGSE